MNQAEAITHTVASKGLDYSFIGLVIAVLIGLITALVYAVTKYSKFNQENQSGRQEIADHLNRKMYETGTAPLVLAISNYMHGHLIDGFDAEQQIIIDEYEEERRALMDP